MSERRALVDVALGRRRAEAVVRQGTLVDVATRRLIPGVDVAIYGGRIALMGEVDHAVGPETEIIEADGLYIAPGFIDAHYHIESSRLTPRRHAQLTLPHGTTAIFEEPHEICNVLGLRGVIYMLREAEGLPQRIYVSIPSAVPPTPHEETGGYIGKEEAAEALGWRGIVGVGEVMDYASLFGHGDRLWGVIEAGLMAGRVVEGHGAPEPPEADALTSSGISSTHFSASGETALRLLERGLFLQLKLPQGVGALEKLVELEVDWQMVGLCVDDRPADEIESMGHMDHAVRTAIEAGLEPLTAYQLATLNNARHWRMEGEIGLIAPGRMADILLISDLEEVEIERVITDGVVVAERGDLVAEIPIPEPPKYVRRTIRLPRPLTPRDFEVEAPPPRDRRRVKALVLRPWHLGEDLKELVEELPVEGGVVQRDLERGINKVAIVNRFGRGIGVSFWEVGYREGAVAMSVLHDSHHISVIGATDGEMAVAVNRVMEMGGGIVVVRGERAQAELPLPIAGLMSDAHPKKVVEGLRRVREAAEALEPSPQLGEDPIDAQSFLFLTCYPRKIALTDKGLINLKTGERIPPIW
jgi:adenine deaminase